MNTKTKIYIKHIQNKTVYRQTIKDRCQTMRTAGTNPPPARRPIKFTEMFTFLVAAETVTTTVTALLHGQMQLALKKFGGCFVYGLTGRVKQESLASRKANAVEISYWSYLQG